MPSFTHDHTADQATESQKATGSQSIQNAASPIENSDRARLAAFESLSVPGRGLYTEESRLERLEFLRQKSNHNLDSLQETRLHSENLRGNIENFIGAVEVPVGLAGPLLINWGERQEVLYAPIATTEGALVSSIARGAKALSLSGGVQAKVFRRRMNRAPCFELPNATSAIQFVEWVQARLPFLKKKIKEFSNFSELVAIEPFYLGRNVHIRFEYETADASGQNMTTICTWNCCKYIYENFPKETGIVISEFFLEGNGASDKKIASISRILGRGRGVIAEAVIKREVLEQTLKVTPEKVLNLLARGKSMNFYTGAPGTNVNVSNMLAAIFTATGQDIACVHESAAAEIHFEMSGNDLYVSVTIPNLIVGTVGGGVHLPTQRQCLEMMDCYGRDRADRFAEIICAFTLALEISTISAMAGGQFAGAHERLGRNNSTRAWLKKGDLNSEFFTELLGKSVSSVHGIQDFSMGDSLITESSSQVTKRMCGLMPFRLVTDEGELSVLVKAKPLDKEVILASEMMALFCGEYLAEAYKATRKQNVFANCHLREIAIANFSDPRIKEFMPKIYGTLSDNEREAYFIVQELLSPQIELLNSVNQPELWTSPYIQSAIDGLAKIHAAHLGKVDVLVSESWHGPFQNKETMLAQQNFFRSMALYAGREFPEIVSQKQASRVLEIIESLETWWQELDQMPKTLIHHDFNPRNLAFRNEGGRHKLVAYDWELATTHVPQRDLAELLCFILPEDAKKETILHWVEHHRQKLEQESGVSLDKALWMRGFQLALYDFLINRVGMYFVAHTFKQCSYLARVNLNAHRILSLIEEN